MKLVILPDKDKCGEYAAMYVVKKILDFNPTSKVNFILGIPCGSGSDAFFKCLIKQAKKKKLSFQYVAIFSMVAYMGIKKTHEGSIESYLYKTFFKHVDVDPKKVYILNGATDNHKDECVRYENLIDQIGPVDLFVSDVFPNGQIAFNEPGSSLTSLSRIKAISEASKKYLEPTFGTDVPSAVLTVGIGTIMKSNEVMFMITGSINAVALSQAIEGGVSSMCPLSMFQQHPHVAIICDNDATVELKVKTVNYFNNLRSTFEGYDIV